MPMTATVHVHRGPSGPDLTDALLEQATGAARDDPGSVLWLAPTARAVDELRGRAARRGGVCGLRWATFADLAEVVLLDQPPARLLSAAQRRLLVEEVVADLVGQGELNHFARVSDTAGFVERLVAFVVEMQRAGVCRDALARTAVTHKDQECARLYARYQRELARLGLHDGDGREALAAEVLRHGMPMPLDGVRRVVVNGFTEFGAAQTALLEALAGHVQEVHVGLLDEPGERAELFQAVRSPRLRFGLLASCSDHQMNRENVGLPAGLVHLRRQLFRSPRRVELSDNACGVEFVEAPGLVGEVRLVARQVKTLLLEGVPASEVLIVARDLTPYVDLLRDLFGEYEVPLEIEGTDPLVRLPGVAILLRAVRLADDDFPFAGVTALLRHTFFRPDWPEVGSPDLPQRAEMLLRLLAEPRGRDAYLHAVARWAEREQPGLEDEAAEQSRRRRTHELARECQAFLVRFFRSFDGAPDRDRLAAHLAWLRAFAEQMGIARACLADERNRAAWDVLWAEAGAWQRRHEQAGDRPLDRRTFQCRLLALASGAGLPRTAAGLGRARALPAVAARHLTADHVFVLGLGERGFPRPGGEPSLLDDTQREELNRAGLAVAAPGDHLAGERLLFYQVVCAARRRLVLAYPAVDERGQELLPGSFLVAVRDSFLEGRIPRLRRRMLVEGLGSDAPLSLAEYRACVGPSWPAGAAGLPDDVRANLANAAQLVQMRFAERRHTPYDGLFGDRLIVEWVGKQFGPGHVFSPTALEDYVACPFRFLLRHGLHLEPLEEPSEQIEVTRRGMAFHRALARLHRRLREQGTHAPTAATQEEVLREMAAAVDEDVHRAAGPASKALWRLEGQRLLRVARRYPGQWSKFLEPWLARGVAPRPHLFEVDFGLPVPEGQVPMPPLVLRALDVEVRISGRIDRVDLAELDEGLGFWIIDYKTGRSSHYTSTDLAAFRKLQLTLYALAVESVLLAGHGARPLGLAYWLVGEGGPKVALPGRTVALWLEEPGRWQSTREQLSAWVATIVKKIREGAFPLAPRVENCTLNCPYGQVCRIGQARAVGKVWELIPPGNGERRGVSRPIEASPAG
jgi:ATP-dependent helicase/nuclease subunit B